LPRARLRASDDDDSAPLSAAVFELSSSPPASPAPHAAAASPPRMSTTTVVSASPVATPSAPASGVPPTPSTDVPTGGSSVGDSLLAPHRRRLRPALPEGGFGTGPSPAKGVPGDRVSCRTTRGGGRTWGHPSVMMARAVVVAKRDTRKSTWLQRGTRASALGCKEEHAQVHLVAKRSTRKCTDRKQKGERDEHTWV
jgi:hypothetical protein